MNRRKSDSRLAGPSLVLLGVAAVLVSSGGVGYVVVKNKQITARREISKIQKKMDEHNVSIALHQSDIEETLGIFRLREHLKEVDSPLVEIRSVEVYRDSDDQPATGETVAHR